MGTNSFLPLSLPLRARDLFPIRFKRILMPFHSEVLKNGLKIIGETSPSARSTAIAFFVRTGSRDETPEGSGASHFLQHMGFKGPPRRSALDANPDFCRIGLHSNAFASAANTLCPA